MRKFGWLVLLCGTLLGAQIPPGWKVVKSPQRLTRTASPADRGGGGSCQLAVPGDWVVDTEANRVVGQTGHMKSANGKVSVSIQEHPPGQSLSRAKTVALMFDKRNKVQEDSPKRVWLTNSNVLGTTWTILVAGNPVCDAQIIIEDPTMKDIAKKVAMTVAPSK